MLQQYTSAEVSDSLLVTSRRPHEALRSLLGKVVYRAAR